ncbi:hypothetical protein JCM10450v2_005903 [Rhodotorula kratochvilovae]
MSAEPLAAPASPATPHSVSAAARLPDELWLAILSHFDYFELKKASRVNKQLFKLVQDPSFDTVLFRRKPREGEYKLNNKITLHPMIECADVTHTGEGALIEVGRHEYNALDFAAADEFATMPACTTIQFDVGAEEYGYVSCPTGITVRKFLEEVKAFWAVDSLPDLVEACLSGSISHEDYARQNGRILCHAMLLDDKAWSKWLAPFWIGDGAIGLRVHFTEIHLG